MARIIIADDDEIVGEIVRDTLLANGHGVGLVTDGDEALRVVKARRPDLLILDCNMPGTSGVLVLRELRNTPALFDLPVMMLTARRSSQDVDLAMFAGADAYVKKPFDPEALVFQVEELLAERERANAILAADARGSRTGR
ncbi:response regulator transcription factor [Sphingomonas endolithica]|uniref:response regulator transcription factor n=1 Tax=Sphingomonas endolithica TaxID=2972485 RepID=UPI0021AF9FBD|nr:response regulator [Sphingomonas sp. ZFBP2030]